MSVCFRVRTGYLGRERDGSSGLVGKGDRLAELRFVRQSISSRRSHHGPTTGQPSSLDVRERGRGLLPGLFPYEPTWISTRPPTDDFVLDHAFSASRPGPQGGEYGWFESMGRGERLWDASEPDVCAEPVHGRWWFSLGIGLRRDGTFDDGRFEHDGHGWTSSESVWDDDAQQQPARRAEELDDDQPERL